MQQNKATTIIIDASVTRLRLSVRKLQTLVTRALELLAEFDQAVETKIIGGAGRDFVIAVYAEHQIEIRTYEVRLQGEGVRSTLTELWSSDIQAESETTALMREQN